MKVGSQSNANANVTASSAGSNDAKDGAAGAKDGAVVVMSEQEFPPLGERNDIVSGCRPESESEAESRSGTKPRETTPLTKSWAEVAVQERQAHFQTNVPMLEHKPQVTPVFVNYKWISFEGQKTPLIDIAVAVGKAVGNVNVDAIQPTRNDWQIYVKMEKDQAVLIATGLDIAGKHISLESHTTVVTHNAKIMVKDLPLNEEVLEAFKQLTPVASLVHYSNIWIDGHQTHLRNGDHFLYVAEEHVHGLPSTMTIWDMKARIFKPTVYSRCSRCQETGHRASSLDCPARALPEVQASVEAF